MIFDNTVLLSDAQAVTASAPSSNVLDLGATGTPMFASGALVRDIGKGALIPFLAQVVDAFEGAATLQIALSVSATEDFDVSEQVWISPETAPAKLVPGFQFNIDFVPKGTNQRYVRLDYIVKNGPFSGGAVTAGVTMGNQTNG